MQDWDDKDQEKYKATLSALKSIKVEPSPYMKTRILANVKAAEEAPKVGFHWMQIFIGSFATAAIAFIISYQLISNNQGMAVEVGKAYLVKADLREAQDFDPSYIEIELVGNVEFSSQKFQHIKEMRTLTMSWEKLAGKQYLPVVVKGTERGESHVRVHFYDGNGKKLKTQDYQFDFQKEAS